METHARNEPAKYATATAQIERTALGLASQSARVRAATCRA
jgi:hypothetical protein